MWGENTKMEMQKKHRWFLITLLNFITLLFVFYVQKKKTGNANQM